MVPILLLSVARSACRPYEGSQCLAEDAKQVVLRTRC